MPLPLELVSVPQLAQRETGMHIPPVGVPRPTTQRAQGNDSSMKSARAGPPRRHAAQKPVALDRRVKQNGSEMGGRVRGTGHRQETCASFAALQGGDTRPAMRPSQRNSFLEPVVLGFGLLVDRNVGIGVLPQIQESLVGLA